MGDQPGAGNSRSYKIRGYTRERHSTKPYARPPERKSVLETVKDFFSPSWLVDFFKGNRRPETIHVERDDEGSHSGSISKGVEQSTPARYLSESHGVSGIQSQVGNGQMKSLFAPGYFSSALREREVSSETPSASRPLRTAGLSTASVGYGQPSSGSRRSEKSETELPGSSNQDLNVSKESLLDEGKVITTADEPVEERTQPGAIRTSTPAMFSIPGSTRRSRTSFLGQPSGEAHTTSVETTSRAVFKPCLESRPQPFLLPKSRPSFSLSAFGSPLPLQPPQGCGLSSTFYHGRTSFGGASSFHSSGYKRIRTGSPAEGEVYQPVRKQIKPKPVSTVGSSGVTSQTAKRILEALESMSSPLIDARKIPTPPVTPSASLLSFSPAKRKRPPTSSQTVGSPSSLQAHLSGPPVQDLSAPQRASISRPGEKASTLENVGRTSVSFFSTATTTIATFSKPSVSSFTPTPLPISLSPSSSDGRAGGKMKSARSTSHYTQRGKQEHRGDQEVVNLLPEVTTAVPLPLPNGKSLPLFSFSSSSHTGGTDSNTDKVSFSTDSGAKTADITKNNFKFSAPQPKLPSLSHPSSSENSLNKITFSFSQPVPVSKSNSRTSNNSLMNVGERIPNIKTKSIEKSIEPNNNLLKTLTPLCGSWTCDTCLVSNKGTDLKCISCESYKPSSEKLPAKEVRPVNNDLFQKFAPLPASEQPTVPQGEDLMKKFAPPAGSWTCDTSILTNKSTDSSCVASHSGKPGASKTVTTSITSLGSSSSLNSDKSLAAKFAPPAGSWCCDTCMINNKAENTSCVACETPKPGAKPSNSSSASFGMPSSSSVFDKDLAKKFAPPVGSWSCDTCMINNKAENSSCTACQTPKPGAKSPGAKSSENAFSSTTFQFGYNKMEAKTKADTSVSSSVAFKFGTSTAPYTEAKGESNAATLFNFGTSNAANTEAKGESNAATLFKFGTSNAANTEAKGEPNAATLYKFGTSSAANTEAKGESNATTLFKFGTNSSVDQSSKSDADNATSGNGKEKDKLPATFRFGTVSQSSDSGASSTKEEGSKSKTVSFSFGTSNHTGCTDKGVNKDPELSFGSKNPAEKDKVSSEGLSFEVTKDKPNSIAAAAAAGFLKVPEVTTEGKAPVKNVEEPSAEVGPGMTIASASKAGLLNVPAVGENKGDAVVPLNVNLFGSSSSSMKSDMSNVSKPAFPGFLPPSNPSTSGFSFAAPSAQAASFKFGTAGQTVVSSSSGRPAAFSFGAPSAAAVGFPTSVPTTSTPAVPSFSFTPNVVPPTASSSVSAPFGLVTSSAAPAPTPSAAPFSFTAPAVNATSSGSSNMAQTTASAPLVQSAAPQALFSFGGNLGSAVTSSTTGHIPQTFGIASASGKSSAEPAKPFSFNAASNSSSLQQGFSFAPPSKPAAAPSPFNFSGSAPKTNINFGGFGATQLSSKQPAANSPFMFGVSSSTTPSDETMDADGNSSLTTAAHVFGATGPPAGSTFGSSGSSGGFSFGGQAAPATGGFNFGAAQQPNTGQSPFVFGAGGGTAPAFGASTAPRAPAPASGGFDFSGAAVSMTSPGGFNFGGGVAKPQGEAMFSAGTTGDPVNPNPAIAQRRFKKAVRRTPRR